MKSLFLCADPSLLSGAARILDLGGVYDVYNSSSSGAEADAKAIYCDWAITGQDIQHATEEFEAEHCVK